MVFFFSFLFISPADLFFFFFSPFFSFFFCRKSKFGRFRQVLISLTVRVLSTSTYVYVRSFKNSKNFLLGVKKFGCKTFAEQPPLYSTLLMTVRIWGGGGKEEPRPMGKEKASESSEKGNPLFFPYPTPPLTLPCPLFLSCFFFSPPPCRCQKFYRGGGEGRSY